jgi:hypothetical protein
MRGVYSRFIRISFREITYHRSVQFLIGLRPTVSRRRIGDSCKCCPKNLGLFVHWLSGMAGTFA